ncbi:acyl-CoA dehydrogenase family protein, partial (plasmid) [Chromobacterium amazonense]
MDFALSEDQLAFQQSARDFAERELGPRAAEWDAESIFPLDAIRKSGDMGFLGLYTPEAYGGLGLSRLDSAIVFEELAAGCTSTAAYLTIHNMVSWMIASFGSKQLAE